MILAKIKEVVNGSMRPKCGCHSVNEESCISDGPIRNSEKNVPVEMDKMGYFVIYPQNKKRMIIVEHYSYNNKLQHTIERDNAKSLYMQLVENKWVSMLSHAAYLGKELEKAELSMKYSFKYVQDGA